MNNKNIPDSTIIKCLIRDNRCLMEEIKTLEQSIKSLTKEINNCNAKFTKKCQEFANYKSQSKTFYKGITKEEGIEELLKENRKYRKEEIQRLRKQVEDLTYTVGLYARILQENNLLNVKTERNK